MVKKKPKYLSEQVNKFLLDWKRTRPGSRILDVLVKATPTLACLAVASDFRSLLLHAVVHDYFFVYTYWPASIYLGFEPAFRCVRHTIGLQGEKRFQVVPTHLICAKLYVSFD